MDFTPNLCQNSDTGIEDNKDEKIDDLKLENARLQSALTSGKLNIKKSYILTDIVCNCF